MAAQWITFTQTYFTSRLHFLIKTSRSTVSLLRRIVSIACLNKFKRLSHSAQQHLHKLNTTAHKSDKSLLIQTNERTLPIQTVDL